MKDVITVFSTVSSKKEGQTIADILVKDKLAACVQIIKGLESTYMWEKKIRNDKEFLMLIKTRKILFPKVIAVIQKNNSYKVPQILALPVVGATASYLKWMKNCLRSK